MEADNKLQLHRLSERAKCADVSWGAIRLTARAPKSTMIGSMFAVNGKQQLKTGLCPAVERQGRVKVVRFPTV